jgi:hypothetical protein
MLIERQLAWVGLKTVPARPGEAFASIRCGLMSFQGLPDLTTNPDVPRENFAAKADFRSFERRPAA